MSASSLTPSRSGPDDETWVGDEIVRPNKVGLGRGDVVGRYMLVDRLGQGAMGQVFRAYDPELDRRIAIKILLEEISQDPGHRERLLREARAMARIDHPNVIRVHDVGIHNGAVFIAMELVDGPTLATWLKTPRSRPEVLEAFVGAAQGLAAAHAAGVVHRDFKPTNVLLADRRQAKVGDFGLAGVEDTTTEDDEGTVGAVGTPAYMSPEHLRGAGIDARSDQFSFAIALHLGLYGRRPFEGETWPELAAVVLSGELSPELLARRGRVDRLLRRALSREPDERFASMEQLIAELERIRRPRWPRWALLAGGALAGAGALAWPEPEPVLCEQGQRRVERAWSAEDKKTLELSGEQFTTAHLAETRTRFTTALDDYAARWAAAYDQSCAALGPGGLVGSTPAQQLYAECLENRLDVLHGFVRFATAEPLDSSRVEAMVGSLPSLEDCDTEQWHPSPSNPEDATKAIALRKRIRRVRWARLADRIDTLKADPTALVEEVRALGEPYMLTSAIIEHARIRGRAGETELALALLHQALELALAKGFDGQAARIINHMLLVRPHEDLGRHEAKQLEVIARGLAERQGGDPELLGNISLNLGNALRAQHLPEEALAMEQRAEEYFTRAGDDEGAAKARLNQAISRLRQGRGEQAMPALVRAVQEIERTSGEASPAAFVGRRAIIMGLTINLRNAEAFEQAKALYQHAREHYAPSARTYRDVAVLYLRSATNVGAEEQAEPVLRELQTLEDLSHERRFSLDILASDLAARRGHPARALAQLHADELLAALIDDHPSRLRLRMALARLYMGMERWSLAQDLLTDPVTSATLSGTQAPLGTRADAALLLAVLDDLAGPSPLAIEPLLEERVPLRVHKLTVEAARAIELGPTARASVERIRDQLAGSYDDKDSLVRTLDIWLAAAPRREVEATGEMGHSARTSSTGRHKRVRERSTKAR